MALPVVPNLFTTGMWLLIVLAQKYTGVRFCDLSMMKMSW